MSDKQQGRFRLRTSAARERDVFRHLHPWTHEHRGAALHRNAFPGGSDSSEALGAAEPCPDTALVAFAQLCALRLRARRCFVTLVCSSVEYVLAEASRSSSLQYHTVEDVRDTPWLGTCSFLRDEGLTSAAIDGWRRARNMREAPTDADFYYTDGMSPHWHIISDVRKEEQYLQRGFISRSPAPGVRFYAAIPLRSATGSVLGALTIVDDAPRWGLSANELAFMEDMADTITQHLDAVVVRSQRQRSERLIQSLGLFNNGKKSLRQWWLKAEDERIATAGRHATRQTQRQRKNAVDAEFGVQGSSSSSTGTASGVHHDEIASETDSDGEDREGSDPVESMPSSLQNTVAGVARKHADVSGHDFAPATVPHPPTPKLLLEPPTPSSLRRKATKGQDHANFDLETASRRTYGRASNLMRQALGADGVVFLNANIANTRKRSQSSDASGKSQSPAVPSDNDTSDGSVTGTDRQCTVEAFSTRELSSINQPNSSYRFDVSESFLAMLIRRYPQGRIFNFAPDGSCYSSSEESVASGSNSESASNTKGLRIPRDGRRLGNVMVGAKSIAFYPLFDDSQDRWCSGMFVWSTSALRYFDPTEDITYLASWSHSILAELARLQTIASDKAKGSFISSISHELRSPLHGILAGIEFLEETELTTFQEEMSHTIRMAGQTLLDTVDHILDFAKISSFTRAQNRQRVGADATRYSKRADANIDSAEIGVTAAVDLALLTENTIETVVNAYRFQKSRMSREDVPSVAVNIEWRSNWMVELQPGSWTRILNNLLGNALKYTETGLITIRLESSGSAPDSSGLQPIRLTVQDTGIGMTKQFLTRELYTPFKQANSHASGTGLGLSIVRRICKDSGADLNITSDLGVGTCATVDLRARFVPEAADSASRGLNVERYHWITPEKSTHSTTRSIGSSVMLTARDWLECETTKGPTFGNTNGSVVYAIAEEDFLDWTSRAKIQDVGNSPSHVLVLGRSMRSVSLDTPFHDLPFTPIYVHQPIGPQKLLRAIAADQSSTEMGLERVRHALSSPVEYEAGSNRRLSIGIPPIGYRHWENHDRLPGPLTDNSTPSSAIFSVAQPSVSIPTTTERSNSIDSTFWPATTEANTRDTVLLVEDNEVNMRLLMALMKKLKYKYLCAVNGREAVDLYRENAPSVLVVFMDISMPVLDGFQATTMIRETERRRRLQRSRIVALTGVTSEAARNQAFASGVDDFFSKPVGMKEVKDMMAKLTSTESMKERLTE